MAKKPPPSYEEVMGIHPTAPTEAEAPPYGIRQVVDEDVTGFVITDGVQQSSVPVTEVHVIQSNVFGEYPVVTTCPYCHERNLTRVQHEPGSLSWLLCLGLCLIGCGLFSCIPCCLDATQDTIHRCSRCSKRLGTSARL